MGPLRGGLILSLLPGAAWPEVCDKMRPGWDPGTQATAWSELIHLASSPAALVLFALTALVLRFRSQWGGLAIVVLWTLLISLPMFLDDGGISAAGMAEGCIGSPTLFIALVAAICVATILYTAPRPRDGDKPET